MEANNTEDNLAKYLAFTACCHEIQENILFQANPLFDDAVKEQLKKFSPPKVPIKGIFQEKP